MDGYYILVDYRAAMQPKLLYFNHISTILTIVNNLFLQRGLKDVFRSSANQLIPNWYG